MNNDQSFIEEDKIKGKVQDYKSLAYLLRFARADSFGFLGAFSLIFLSAVFAMISARYMGVLVEDGLVANNSKMIGLSIIVILACEILAILILWQGRKWLSLCASRFTLAIRKALFSHIHQLPLTYYDSQPQGRIVTRITYDVEGIEEFFTSSLGRLLNSIVTFTVAIGAMLASNFFLGSILNLVMIPAILLTYLTRIKLKEINRDMSKKNSACNAKLSEYLNALPIIRGFGLEKWSFEIYQQIVAEHRDSTLAANSFYAITRPITTFLCYLPLITLLGVGGSKVLAGTLSIGLFVAFVRYCERFSLPLAALTREIHVIQQAFTSAERITTFLQERNESQELGADGEIVLKGLRGDIKFEDLTMSYDGKNNVLKNINFKIAAGEKIGLVGRTGSGKTTIVSMLSRLYEFQGGRILLDSIPIRNINRESLRQVIGLVSQDVVIFKGSLRENLTCEEDRTDDEIIDACKETGLIQVMQKNDLSLDSQILEGGANLSVGEKQLISLTRVLLKDPSILIMDEATANIDPFFERIIHRAVHKIMSGRTCLLIAHRLETLKKCDRILVFKNGELVESGTGESLIDQKGYYASMVDASAQLKA